MVFDREEICRLNYFLFSIYLDDLSKMLSDSGIGCYVDNVCVNHVFYADDLCLMAPCAIALQQLMYVTDIVLL